MSFRIAQKTLERLEWPQVVAKLRERCRTPGARRLLGAEDSDENASPENGALFEDTLAGALERLAETAEARGLLDAAKIPPLGGVGELGASFQRVEKGGALAGLELLEVGSSLAALRETRRFLTHHTEEAPRLAEIGALLADHRALEEEIERCIDNSGELRDSASSALKKARGESHRLSGDLQARLSRYLQNSDVASALTDSYFTVRNDRFVLPVRADRKAKVRGIVHDASGSGTTLFIEPEGVVDLNNRLKQAEIAIAQETQRILHEISQRLQHSLPDLVSDLATLEVIDLAFARGELAREMEAVQPEVGREGIFDLPQLRHPLLPPEESVPNDLRLGRSYHVMVISGPNGGGKTVAMKAVALAALSVRAGLHVAASPGARVDWVDDILADIGDDQDIRESLSTFSAHMANVSSIVARAGEHSLVVLDEVGVGTDPSEGAALAQAVLEGLADSGARVIATTHYNLLKEMAAVDSRFTNACVEFDPDTLAPTFRLHVGSPGVSSATAVAARMGMAQTVLERANTLLEREDRRLDQMLTELANSRAALDREQSEVRRLRVESEATRDDYRAKLEKLQERRDKLFHEMRTDLDRSFRDAHAQVAGVIRDLQRGGRAQDAAKARDRLQSLETRTEEAAERVGVKKKIVQPEGASVDWRRAKPGDTLRLPGGGSGVLLSLPDRRGRVSIQAGTAKLTVEAERLGTLDADAAPTRKTGTATKVKLERAEAVDPMVEEGQAHGGTHECDLRGLRVHEALDRVADALDAAKRDGYEQVRVIHGHGTGALRKAVREFMHASPFVANAGPGERTEGGEGVTVAKVRN